MVEPVSAGITAGVGLLGGLLGQAAQAAREQKAREQEMLQNAYKAQMQGAQAMGQGQSQGLQALIDSYKQVLARPPVL